MTAILEKKRKKKRKKNLFTQHPRRWRKKWPALNFYFVRSFIPADDSVWKVAKTRRKKKGSTARWKYFFFVHFTSEKSCTQQQRQQQFTHTHFLSSKWPERFVVLPEWTQNEEVTQMFFPFPFLYTIRDFCYFVFPFLARAWVCRKSPPPSKKDGR